MFVDHFTKADQLASTVVRAFHDAVICRHGCPGKLLSNNASIYRSRSVQALCDAFGVRKVFSTPYNPQGDAVAERFMRTLEGSIAIAARKAPCEWDVVLPDPESGTLEYMRRLRNVIAQSHRRAKRLIDTRWEEARAQASRDRPFGLAGS